jgi:hypothetical protein
MKKRFFLLFVMVGLLVTLASCAASNKYVKLTLSADYYEVYKGQTIEILPTVNKGSAVKDVTIEYSWQETIFDVTASISGSGSIDPSGTTSVVSGESFTLTINADNPTVTDNGVDVTSQLEQVTGGTATLIPEDYTSTGFTVTDITNAYHDATNSTYASLELNGGTTGNIYLDLGGDIPIGATIVSVSCQATL